MEEFYPSEIARLVLGYLKETKCPKAWETFLGECSDLEEHSRLYKEGKFNSTNVNGKSLLDILNEYCSLKRDAVFENNQNKFSKNTYQIEVLKSPNKAKENVYARFRFNQKFQTQSVLSSSFSHIQSPCAKINAFRTPPSRSSGQTPRRRLECQATPLNFGPEAELNQSNSDLHVNECANTSLQAPDCDRNSGINTCYSDSVISVKSKIRNKNVQKGVNLKSHQNIDTISTEHLPSNLTSHPKSGDINVQHTNLAGSQNADISNSDSIAYLISKGKVPDPFDYSDLIQLDNSVSASEKQISQKGENYEERGSSELNKNFIYHSSEITANGQNITMTTLENCFTPQYSIDPPTYNRAPLTNSPRIVLSHDRSQIPSLTTPIKDTRYWTDEEWSPKRKGLVPRRRLITESPLSKYMEQSEALSFESMLEYMYGKEEELTNNPLVQLLTDNINKVKQCEMLKECDGQKSHGQDFNVENIVKNTTELMEEDPVLGKYFAVGDRSTSSFNAEPSTSNLHGTNSADCEIESFSTNIVENNDHEKYTDDIQNEKTSQNVQNAGESDILVNALRETFGEISNSSQLATSNFTTKANVENDLISHETFSDVYKVNECINIDPRVNTPTTNNGSETEIDSSVNSCINPVKSCGNLTSKSIEKGFNNNFVKGKTDISAENQTTVDSADAYSTNTVYTSEHLNNVKTNLEIGGTEAGPKNGSQSGVNAQINQTALCNTPYITTHAANSAANFVFSNNQLTNTVITPQLPGQPVLDFPVTLPYLGLMQNGVYRIIINSPIAWNPAPVSTIPAADISNPIIFNPTPVTTLTNVENVEIVNRDVNSGNTANFVTTSMSGNQSSSFINSHIPQNVSDPPQVKILPKKNQRSKKRKKSEKEVSPTKKRHKKENSKSSTKKSKTRKKCGTKRKPLCLFPSSPNSNEATPNKIDNNVPVLSIPDTPGQSSAFKILSQITGQFEREERSPVLKVLMSNAAMLSKTSNRVNSSHVRCLDFESKSTELVEENNETSSEHQMNSKKNKSKGKIPEKSPVQNRRSLRIQQSKEKQNQSSCQEQNRNNLKSSSVHPQLVTNKRKRSLPKKRVQVNDEKSATDMATAILNSMEEARQHAINSKKLNLISQNSEKNPKDDVLNKISSYTLPFNEEIIELIDADNEVSNNNEIGINLSVCSTVKNKSVCDPKGNSRTVIQNQNAIFSSTEDIDNFTELENSVHCNSCENIIQKENTLQNKNTNSSTSYDNSKKDKNSENIISEPVLTESSHSRIETENLYCKKSLEVNISSNNKEDSQNKRTKNVNKQKKVKNKELSNLLFGSDVSSDESSVEENLNTVQQMPDVENSSANTSVAEKEVEGSKEKGENTYTILPSCTSDKTPETEKNAIIPTVKCINLSEKEECVPVNLENTIVSSLLLQNQELALLSQKNFDDLKGNGKIFLNDKEMEVTSYENNERELQKSVTLDSEKQMTSSDSVRTEQNSPVSAHIADNISMNYSAKTFHTNTYKDKKKCKSMKSPRTIDNYEVVQISDLCNLASRSVVNTVDTAEKNNSSILSQHSNYSFSSDIGNENITDKCYETNLCSVPGKVSNIKQKNISNVLYSSVSELKTNDNVLISFEKSKQLVTVEESNKLSENSRTSFDQNQGLSVLGGVDLEQKGKISTCDGKKKSVSSDNREKGKSQNSPVFINAEKQVTSDIARVEKQKTRSVSSTHRNLNMDTSSNIQASLSKHSSVIGGKNVDQNRSFQTNICKDKKIFLNSKSPRNSSCHEIEKCTDLSNLTSRSGSASIGNIAKGKFSVSKYSKYSSQADDRNIGNKCNEGNRCVISMRESENEKSISKLSNSSIPKESLENLKNTEILLQIGDQNELNESSKPSNLLIESVDLNQEVLDVSEKNHEVLSHDKNKKKFSEKHEKKELLYSSDLIISDRQTTTSRSLSVENQMMTTSSSFQHNVSMYSNVKAFVPRNSLKIKGNSLDHNKSPQADAHVSRYKKERLTNNRSRNSNDDENFKNQDCSNFTSEFQSVRTIDATKRNSIAIYQQSNYSAAKDNVNINKCYEMNQYSGNIRNNSAEGKRISNASRSFSCKESPKTSKVMLAYSERSKNRIQMDDKKERNERSKTDLLPGKCVNDFEHNKKALCIEKQKNDSSECRKKIRLQNPDILNSEKLERANDPERTKKQSGTPISSLHNRNVFVPSHFSKSGRNKLDCYSTYHTNAYKNFSHSKYQRNSDNPKILKPFSRSRYTSVSDTVNTVDKGKSNLVSKHCDITSTNLNIRENYYKKDRSENTSEFCNSDKQMRIHSSVRAEKEAVTPMSSKTAYKIKSCSEPLASRRSLIKRQNIDHNRPFHSKKSMMSPKTRKHLLTLEKSENLTLNEKYKVNTNSKTSSLLVNSQESVELTRKITDREPVLVCKEQLNISSQNDKTIESQDSVDIVNAQNQISSNISLKIDKHSSNDPLSSVKNVSNIPNVKSYPVFDGTKKHSQSDDSLSGVSSKETHEINRVHPPFKKRIRPIPVRTHSDLEIAAFSPFLPGQKISATTAGADFLNLENSSKREVYKETDPISAKNYLSNETHEKLNSAISVSSPIPDSFSSIALSKSPDFNAQLKAFLSNPLPNHSMLVTPVKEVPVTLPVYGSPVSRSQMSNPTTPSPTIKSTFRSSYLQSGKPKSMEYFYRKAFPDKKSDLPISPISFSNSSCTADAFSARRQLLEEESCSQQAGAMCVESRGKTKNVLNEKKMNLYGSENVEEFNADFKKNEVKKQHMQVLNSEFNEIQYKTVEEKEFSGNISNVCKEDMVTEKDNLLSDAVGRKRKRRESLCSETCSTVVDCSDLEIMTPEKNEWLEKPLFSKEKSPMIAKKTKHELSSSSDVTPINSPEKETFYSRTIQSTSHLCSKKSAYKSPTTDVLLTLCDSNSKQKKHMESIAQNFAIQESIVDVKDLQQVAENVSTANTSSHKSPSSKEIDQKVIEGENESPEMVQETSKFNLLLRKIQMHGLDDILDRLEDK